jgi:hypothetical protein
MPYIFDESMAVKYGVDEAIMLQNLAYWVQKNAANGKHIHNGRAWTYNSAAAFVKLFPFWNKFKIRRILDTLEERGAIMSDSFNDVPMDRTKWYSVSDECMMQICNVHLAKMLNAFSGNASPIPDVNTDSKPNINTPPSSPKGEDAPLGFDDFWAAYPRRVGKPAALRAWRSLHVNALDIPRIMDGLAVHKRSEQWTKSNGQFIPYPSTWLNQRRWDGMTPDQPVNITNDEPPRRGFIRYGDGAD